MNNGVENENDFFSNEKELGIMYNQIDIADQSKFNNISEIDDTGFSRDSSIYNSLNGSLEYEKMKNKIFTNKELKEIENQNFLEKKPSKVTSRMNTKQSINAGAGKKTTHSNALINNKNASILAYDGKKTSNMRITNTANNNTNTNNNLVVNVKVINKYLYLYPIGNT